MVNTMYRQVGASEPQKEWDTGICGCCAAPCNTQCLACCCPCYLYGLLATSPALQGKDEDPHARCKCSGVAPPTCGYFVLDYMLFGVMYVMSNQFVYLPVAGFPLSCLIHCGLRKRIRSLDTNHELQGSCCSDVFLTFCCACCALIQEHEQLRKYNV